jgi:V/A-type H+-transporting ATPase subunit I
MITPMVKVSFMGPERNLMGVLDLLHSLGAVHMEPYPIHDERLKYIRLPADKKAQTDLINNLDSLLEKVNRLFVACKAPFTPSTAPAWLFANNISREDLEESVRQAEDHITDPYSQLLELKNELALLQRYERVLAALYPLLEDAVELQQLELMGIIMERKRIAILPLLEKELSRITDGRSKIFTRAMDRDNIAAILAYPGESEEMIHTLFSEESIAEIRLPDGYEDKTLATTLRLMFKRQRELPKLIGEMNRVLESFSEQWYGTLTRIRVILKERADTFTTLAMSAHSRHTFFIRGWIPEKKLASMFETINSNIDNGIHIEATPVQHYEQEQVPVQLNNKPIVRVFEPLVRMLALPRYGTLDPTPFVAIFFPLFFGFILGDIAYGLVLLGLSVGFYRKFRDILLIRSICIVFMLSGISATVFGLLFGEFLGNLGEHWGLHALLMDRAKLFLPLLFIAVALGFAHIMLGFLLNMIVSIRHGHTKHWIASLASMLSLSGLALIIVSATGRMQGGYHIGGSLLLLGIPLLVYSEGFLGPLEFLKSFGNILSYARLMAIGVSSVVLAQVANTIGGIIGSIFLGLFVALIFHSLNFTLGVFSPTIHSLRLHYVEFFSKFFQPGGKPYKPFRRFSTP